MSEGRARTTPRRGSKRLGIPRNLDDLSAYAGWVVYQLALDRISADDAKAMQAVLREAREALTARDQAATIEELRARLTELKRTATP
jgi:23S rRNA maturation mini-RNase III